MRRLTPVFVFLLALVRPLGARAEDAAGEPARAEPPPTPSELAASWCAPELRSLSDGLCYFLPDGEGPPRALVLFLHGVIKPDTTWQWAQQRALVRNARQLGLAVLLPRGRQGVGPKGMEQWWTWPTGVAAQRAIEAELVAEWQRARETLEAQNGAAFERLYVFGFSNGAYYGSSLALRGRLEADGYALFAGGSGASYLSTPARKVQRRAPIYVGYGEEDRAARRDCRGLAGALRALGWKHRAVGRRGVGHSMTDAQITEAVRFLDRAR